MFGLDEVVLAHCIQAAKHYIIVLLSIDKLRHKIGENINKLTIFNPCPMRPSHEHPFPTIISQTSL